MGDRLPQSAWSGPLAGPLPPPQGSASSHVQHPLSHPQLPTAGNPSHLAAQTSQPPPASLGISSRMGCGQAAQDARRRGRAHEHNRTGMSLTC